MRLVPKAGATATVAVGALTGLLLLLGAHVAYAEHEFVLTTSEARPGDTVRFSISGMEDGATFSLAVGGREVSQGGDPDGDGVSSSFTMPNLGGTSRVVIAELRITESEETKVLTGTLDYVSPPPAVTGTTETQPPPPSSARPVTRTPPASSPRPRSHARKRRPSRRKAARPRARRSPPRTRQRRASGRPKTVDARGSIRKSRRRSPASPVQSRISSPLAPRTGGPKPPPAGTMRSKQEPSHGRERDGGRPVWTSFPRLSAASPPASSSIIQAVGDRGGVAFAVVAVPGLLGLAALALLGVPGSRRLRRGPRGGDGEEVLRGNIYVPGADGASGSWRKPRDRERRFRR